MMIYASAHVKIKIPIDSLVVWNEHMVANCKLLQVVRKYCVCLCVSQSYWLKSKIGFPKPVPRMVPLEFKSQFCS